MYIMFAPKLFIRDVLAAKAQPGGRHYAIPHLPALAFDRVWLQGYVQDQKDGFINVSDLTADGIWVNVQHAMFQQVCAQLAETDLHYVMVIGKLLPSTRSAVPYEVKAHKVKVLQHGGDRHEAWDVELPVLAQHCYGGGVSSG